MAENQSTPPQVPIEALTQADRTRRVDQSQLFYAEFTKLLSAIASSDSGDSDAVRGALSLSFQELKKYLDSFGAMPALVMEKALILFDDPVCNETEPISVADRLLADGVTQLTFMPGIDSDELLRFAKAVLVVSDKGVSCTDRIWSADVPHVRLDFETEFALPDVSQQALSNEVNQVVERLFESLRESTAELRRLLQGKPEDTEPKGPPGIGMTVIAGMAADDELKKRICESIEASESRVFDESLEIVFKFIESGKAERPDALEAFFTDIADGLLKSGDLFRIRTTVQRIEAMEYENELAMTGYRLRCALKAHFSRSECLNAICSHLVHGSLDDPESIRCLLHTLDDSAVQQLIDILPSVSLQENRRIVCDALVSIGKDSSKEIVSAYKESEGQMAKDLLFVIDQCEFADKYACFAEAMKRPDESIQMEAVSLLSSEKNVRTEQAFKILSTAVMSESENVRKTALRGILESGNVKSGNTLLTVMQSEEFSDREHAERELFFDALGSLNFPAALPFLSRVLSQKKRGFFGGSKIREDKLLAVHSLSKMALLPSYKMLQAAAEDRDNDSKVREEAKKACAMLKKTLFGE